MGLDPSPPPLVSSGDVRCEIQRLRRPMSTKNWKKTAHRIPHAQGLWSDLCGARRLWGQSPSACRTPSCRSLSAKVWLILGLFFGKGPMKMKHPMTLRHPVASWLLKFLGEFSKFQRYSDVISTLSSDLTDENVWEKFSKVNANGVLYSKLSSTLTFENFHQKEPVTGFETVRSILRPLSDILGLWVNMYIHMYIRIYIYIYTYGVWDVEEYCGRWVIF